MIVDERQVVLVFSESLWSSQSLLGLFRLGEDLLDSWLSKVYQQATSRSLNLH